MKEGYDNLSWESTTRTGESCCASHNLPVRTGEDR